MDNGTACYRRFREENDPSGLAEIILQYRDGLIFFLYGIVGNIQTAEELAEDTFVLLGTKKPRDNGKGSFKTWLYTIGRNLARNHLKKQAKTAEVPLVESDILAGNAMTPETVCLQVEQKQQLYRALCQLKSEYRQVLWLLYFEELSHKQVAAILKKNVHTVETLAYRARRSLKTQLEKEGFSYEEL